jgi:predicted nucleic acid-binding protein
MIRKVYDELFFRVTEEENEEEIIEKIHEKRVSEGIYDGEVVTPEMFFTEVVYFYESEGKKISYKKVLRIREIGEEE